MSGEEKVERAAAIFQQGASRVTNCLVDGNSTTVGLWVRSKARCEVQDCDIKANEKGMMLKQSGRYNKIYDVEMKLYVYEVCVCVCVCASL